MSRVMAPNRPWALGWVLFAVAVILLATFVFGW